MWLALTIALALADEPRRVGSETGDHPVRRYTPSTEIHWPETRVVDLFALYRTRGCTLFPPHARRDFRAEIDGSAELALPIPRVMEVEPGPTGARRIEYRELDLSGTVAPIGCIFEPSWGLLDAVRVRDFQRSVDTSIEQAIPYPRVE